MQKTEKELRADAEKSLGFLSSEQRKKLDDFFQETIGINCEQVIGHQLLLKSDVVAEFILVPKRHYGVRKEIVIKRGVELKIIDFTFRALGYSNSFIVEILNPQLEFEKLVDTLRIDISDFEKAMKAQ